MIHDSHELLWNDVYNAYCYVPNNNMKEHLDKLSEYRNSIQFQSSHIIYEKYKRSLNLNIDDFKQLEMVAYDCTKTRLEKGKTPNIDFLNQELSKFIKNKYADERKKFYEEEQIQWREVSINL